MKRPNPCTLKMVALLTPLGRIEVSGCEAGVHNISIQSDGTLDERPSGCMLVDTLENVPSELQVCVDWLLSYFQNPRSLQKGDMPALHHAILLEDTFTSRVLHTLLRYVKIGETVSYKRLAEMAGNIRAARAVGGAMRRNPVPLLIPCHRVISSDRQPGNYMGGKGNHMKCWLLAHERAGGWDSPPPQGGTGVRRSCDSANRPGLKDCSELLGGSRRSDVNTEEMNQK
ncbi:methylated-DNA--protein-cysteine methyltransferase isoform X2 [Brienomyrus brachyistius]|nr:methylated-DNA--protein-cysteine methyltransferase isoform X2 [Brienomyrus brachyistius]XP_048865046.1 methylated-DNA--protein-cysteine methyltransferase isoform X2 [Brienomyrus brachyistius]